MPATIPCPNPNCGQMFAAETIQGTGKLACPRCGTVFQFRPATPQPAQQQIPIAQPVRPVTPTVPTAQPVRPVPPPLPTNPVTATPSVVPTVPTLPAVDEEDEEDEDGPRYRREVRPDPRLAFEDPPAEDEEPDALLRRRRSRPASLGKWLWLGPLLLTCTSTLVVLSWLYIKTLRNDPSANPDAYVKNIENLDYKVPERPWGRYRDDTDRAGRARFAMKLNFVTCRTDPSSAIGIYHWDYEHRMPGDNELIDVALQKLRDYFTSIEWEQKEDGTTLGGVSGLRLEFTGTDGENVFCNGEVHAIAHRGIGYWLFTWCPEPMKDEAAPEWGVLRKQFVLGAKRQGWQPTPPKSEIARVPETPYQIAYPDEMWEVRREEGWDKESRLTLVAYEQEKKRRKSLTDPRQRYSGKMAVCQILRLPKVENLDAAVELARKYVLEQQKAENENAVFQAVEPGKAIKGRIPDGPTKIGGIAGYLLRQELLPEPGGKKRFFLLAIVADATGTLVFEFECNAERREYWEAEFAPVWQSLRVVKP